MIDYTSIDLVKRFAREKSLSVTHSVFVVRRLASPFYNIKLSATPTELVTTFKQGKEVHDAEVCPTLARW